MPSYFGGGNRNDGLYVGLVILAVIIAAAYWYFYVYAKACTATADCAYSKALTTCSSGKCSAPAAGASAFTARLPPPASRARARARMQGPRRLAARKSGFNSDEMNWDTAGSLVTGGTFPYGNLSGYGVSSFGTSYDQLY